MTLSACAMFPTDANKQSDITTIASPPNIPSPPNTQNAGDPDSPQARLAYQDIIDLETTLLKAQRDEDETAQTEQRKLKDRQQLALVHAVQEGIRRQILTPPPYRAHRPSYFEADKPVLYKDFYTWALGFAGAGENHPLDLNLKQRDTGSALSEPSEETEEGALLAGDPLAASGITLPYTPPAGGGPTLSAESLISRETLCLFYTQLSAQQDKAQNLPVEAVDAANPGKSDVYRLSAFSDADQISPWAKKYVATAYKDNLPKTAFGLRPTALVNGQGLQPQKALTRGEALLFLYQFFSSQGITSHNSQMPAQSP